MMKSYQIYQLDLTNPDVINQRKAYLGWSYLIQRSNFNLQQYKKIYEGTIDGENNNDILEELFTKFNLNHPDDYRGRSLSVSDVVILDDIIYYCDDFGWRSVSPVK